MALDDAPTKPPHRRRAAWLAGAPLGVLGAAGLALAVASSASSPSLPRPGTPVLGASVTIAPLRGTVSVAWPGDGWIAATGPTSLPLGTAIGADAATLLVTFARDAGHGTSSASFGGGELTVAQTRAGVTTVSLAGRPPADCVSGSTSDRAFVLRRLYVADTAMPLQVAAADAITSASRATWLVEDRCNGTEVSVRSGRVTVRRTRLTKRARVRVTTVRAGQTVLFAGPPPPGSLRAAPKRSKPSKPGSSGSGGGSTGTSGSGGSGSSGSGTTTPPVSPAQALSTLASQVAALNVPGDDGQTLASAVAAAQSALAAGNTAAACTALAGPEAFNFTTFVTLGASPPELSTAAAQGLYDSVASIEQAIGCTTPSVADDKAADETFGFIDSLASLGLDPSTSSVGSEVQGNFAEVGELIASGDDDTTCFALSFLGEGFTQEGLTADQAAALQNDATQLETDLNCSSSSLPSV